MCYSLKVKYVPGSQLYIADTLSHTYCDALPHSDEVIREIEERVHSIQMVQNLPISQEQLDLKEAISADPALIGL